LRNFWYHIQEQFIAVAYFAAIKESMIMYNKEVVVRCESGLHNRQATYFVQKANEFYSSIWIESGSRKMNAKSLLGIMSLGVVTGASVNLVAEGPDAEAAVNALEALLQRDVY
jgi:phosphocarrier protein